MKRFLEIAEEKDQDLKPAVMAFGRMNPPTSGHEKLVNKVKEIADKHSAPHHIVLSHSQDATKNPLSAKQKVKHASRAFPGTNIEAASKEMPTFFHHAKRLYDAGRRHLIMVAGSDRVKEYHDLLHKYNGKKGHFNFDKIEVKSAGERDPDAEGTSGMSATKMREHARNGNFTEFRKGLPSQMKDHHALELYHDTRKGMGLHENVNRGKFKAIFVTGGPGSGKDIIIREAIAEQKAVEITSQYALSVLLDKQKLLEQTNDYRIAAIRRRSPLIINGTADDYDTMHSIKEELEEIGYSTMMVYVDTTNEISKERNRNLKRMVTESIREEKWSNSQTNKVKFHEEFDDFSLFENNDAPETLEFAITEVYEHVADFFDRKVNNIIREVWEQRNEEVKPKGNKFKDLLKNNNCTACQLTRKFDKIDSVKDGDVASNSSYIFRTYEDSKPTLTINPPPKEPNFSMDKDKKKAGRYKWVSSVSHRIRNVPGVGPEYDTRQQGTVYPMSGLGDVTYREEAENKYNNKELAESSAKSFKQFRKEAIDDPGAVDMGVGGVLGGGSNKEPLETPLSKFGLSGITIEKKKKKKGLTHD
jgi:predicted kinase